MANITLTRDAQQTVTQDGTLQSYRFTVIASAPSAGIPTTIFLMTERPLNPLTGTTTTDFSGVCTPYDISTLPVDAPIPPDTRYRVDDIDVTYQNETDGDEAWESLQEDVLQLLKSIVAGDNLDIQDVVVIST